MPVEERMALHPYGKDSHTGLPLPFPKMFLESTRGEVREKMRFDS